MKNAQQQPDNKIVIHDASHPGAISRQDSYQLDKDLSPQDTITSQNQ